MYVPPIYQAANRAWLRQVVRRYPLGLLLTNGPRTPYATHLPVIFAPGQQEAAAQDPEGLEELAGVMLLGHMNRANPHWDALAEGMSAQLVFTGPHSYVTPTLYETTPAAPTWNFVSVHLQGTLHPFDSFEETLKVVRSTVEAYEKDFGDGWEMDTSLDYFRRIGPAVGAFRFEVESGDGMFKLSQEKEPEVRNRVSARLSDSETGARRELGTFMREFGVAEPHTER